MVSWSDENFAVWALEKRLKEASGKFSIKSKSTCNFLLSGLLFDLLAYQISS